MSEYSNVLCYDDSAYLLSMHQFSDGNEGGEQIESIEKSSFQLTYVYVSIHFFYAINIKCGTR